jgi:4-amino-4-deoxy-L-arabinose transferase-like glycosyltransferase
MAFMNKLESQAQAAPGALISYHWPLVLLLSIFLVVRLLLFITIGPQLYFDSQTYIAPAIAMLENRGYDDFSFWDGSRTPVYPLFLTIVFGFFGKDNFQAVVGAQILLGLVITTILYYVGLRISFQRRIAFLCGLVYALDLSSAAFEHAILSETSTTLLLSAALLLTLYLLDGSSLNYRRVFLLGLLTGLLALCRPVFVFYPILLLTMTLLGYRFLGYRAKGKRRAAAWATTFLLPPILLIGSWTFRNYVQYDYLGISTLLGSNLTQHVGMLMEKAPREYTDLADIYIKYREQRIRESGTHTFAVGLAYEEMMDTTGLSFSQLSKELTKLSLALILQEPKVYIKSFVRSFIRFWSPSVYYSHIARGESILNLAHAAYRIWHFAMLLGFFTGIIYVVAALDLVGSENSFMLRGFALKLAIIFATILYVATVSSLLEYGENPRYKAPVQPLIYLTVPLVYSYRQEARRIMKRWVTYR